jgi:hypothetical protein
LEGALQEAWQCVLGELGLPIHVHIRDIKALVGMEELAQVLCYVGDFSEFSVSAMAFEIGDRSLYALWKKHDKEFRRLYG